MKLKAEIGDEIRNIEITRHGDRVFADIDGRKYELEVSEPEPNVLLMKRQGKVYEAYVSPGIKPGEKQTVSIKGQGIELRLIDPKRLRGSVGSDAHSHGTAQIRTAMPGKVVRVLLKQGDAVNKGDGVIVVEAMKMQNELKSPIDGTVISISATEGTTVAAGDVLATIE